MNDTHKETAPTDTTSKVLDSLLHTLADVGSSWATYGLKVGKMALETSAETLGKGAKALDTLATELDKKTHAPEVETKTEGTTSSDAEAPSA